MLSLIFCILLQHAPCFISSSFIGIVKKLHLSIFSRTISSSRFFFPCFSVVKPLSAFCLFDKLFTTCILYAWTTPWCFPHLSAEKWGKEQGTWLRELESGGLHVGSPFVTRVSQACVATHPCSSAPLRLYQLETVDPGRVPYVFFFVTCFVCASKMKDCCVGR